MIETNANTQTTPTRLEHLTAKAPELTPKSPQAPKPTPASESVAADINARIDAYKRGRS